jgi:hypothetical protein
MIRISRIIAAVGLTALVASEAGAQWNVARFGTTGKTVYTTFGLDPALVTSVGLASVGTLMDHEFQLTGEVGIVTAKVDVRDFRTRLGLRTSLLRWRSVNLTGGAMAVARGTDNSVYRGINFGADVSAALGVYRQRWFAAGDAGIDKAIITHVTHSDWYRQNFYADAKDGWYLDAGGTYRYGLVGGVTVRRAEVMTRLGFLKTERYNKLMPPAYASVGVGFGL